MCHLLDRELGKSSFKSLRTSNKRMNVKYVVVCQELS
jgi:hypothetical protein